MSVRRTRRSGEWAGNEVIIIVIIMTYNYHALINALSAHIIHINLNRIFYTQVEHSPTTTTHTKHHTEIPPPPHTNHNEFKCVRRWSVSYIIHARACARTHTHTHTLTVAEIGYWYKLGRKYCEKRNVFSLAWKDDSVLWEWIHNCIKKRPRRRICTFTTQG